MAEYSKSVAYRIISELKDRGHDPYSMSDADLLAQKGVGKKVFIQIKQIIGEKKFVEQKIMEKDPTFNPPKPIGIMEWARRIFS